MGEPTWQEVNEAHGLASKPAHERLAEAFREAKQGRPTGGSVVGFTGTSNVLGMSVPQIETLDRWLAQLKRDGAGAFVHGCCVGADSQAAALAKRRGYRVLGFPGRPEGHPQRAITPDDETFEVAADPLARNRVIVDSCQILIACPGSHHEVRRSGTWATVRHAARTQRRFVIVWPDGTTSETLSR